MPRRAIENINDLFQRLREDGNTGDEIEFDVLDRAISIVIGADERTKIKYYKLLKDLKLCWRKVDSTFIIDWDEIDKLMI